MERILQKLDGIWEYRGLDETEPNAAFEEIRLPHTVRVLPYNCFDERSYQTRGIYRKRLYLPSEWAGRRLRLRFEGVMAEAAVFLNGSRVGGHRGGYTPFEVDITGQARIGGENLLTVEVDSRELPGIPPFGGQLDYLTYGGIYREVFLLATDPVFIENAQVQSQNLLTDAPSLRVRVFLQNRGGSEAAVRVTASVLGEEGETAFGAIDALLPAEGEGGLVEFPLTVTRRPALWELDDPRLYETRITVKTADGGADEYRLRTGFRQAEFTEKGFFLNGRPVKLFGLNRHQSYPYVGYAMPERVQRRDADILKDELNCNIVRTSHYPQSPHFLNRCDEIGLLVFEEMPGWQFVGNEVWRREAMAGLEEMIRRDWNHPSIVLWGTRINESQDYHDFYTATARLAKELDPTRQTGGVRAIDHSEFLEDVYTANDFVFNGANTPLRPQRQVTGLEKDVPYLVTECNGHMFPTKRFDQEERLVEHALRHAAVHNHAALDDTVCGVLGWCAFDYNTHCQFGSGDKICYHGVMDMFRQPKYAAYFYMSQCSPEKRGVLKIASAGAMGERSGGGVAPFTVFTNYDFIRIYAGERELGTYYPDRDRFPGLAHPPIVAEEGMGFLWGENWKGLRVEAWRRGRPAAVRELSANPFAARLTAAADDDSLWADGSDSTRVVFRLEDQNGNRLPFNQTVLELSLEGPGELIGPDKLPMPGGSAGLWIRAKDRPGEIRLCGRTMNFHAEVVVNVILREGAGVHGDQ